jgi:hypothetical protein
MLTIDKIKIMKLKTMQIKIYLIIYIIVVSIIIIFNLKKNYTMIRLWLMISHMSFTINESNVPYHWHIVSWMTIVVATLAFGSQPRQGVVKVRAKNEA